MELNDLGGKVRASLPLGHVEFLGHSRDTAMEWERGLIGLRINASHNVYVVHYTVSWMTFFGICE